MLNAALTCHPTCVCPPIGTFTAQIAPESRDRWRLRFSLQGAVGELSIPGRTLPRRVDELWRHTCFEAFVSTTGSHAYHEFNFSPSGEWAAYRFDSYRAGVTAVALDAPRIECAETAEHLDLDVELKLPAELTGGRELAISLTAVIESRDASISYWAVKHAALKPDFHHPESLVLHLPAAIQV